MALGSVITALQFNHWAKLGAALKPECQMVIHETALEWQAEARALAAADTHFVEENIYVSDMEGSDYDTSTVEPPGDSYLLPEETPRNDMEAVVGCAANYSEYVEMGTRFMSAQPFFYSAGDLAQAFFDVELGRVNSRLIGVIG